jgi:hypothetical protein
MVGGCAVAQTTVRLRRTTTTCFARDYKTTNLLDQRSPADKETTKSGRMRLVCRHSELANFRLRTRLRRDMPVKYQMYPEAPDYQSSTEDTRLKAAFLKQHQKRKDGSVPRT